MSASTPAPRTRIVATVGPSCDDAATLERLLQGGVDVFRLNLSHGSIGGHLETLERIRGIERGRGSSVAVLADLPGPKIRMESSSHDVLSKGERLCILDASGDPPIEDRWISIPTVEVLSSLAPGHRVLLDDGMIRLVVTSVDAGRIECRVLNGGSLRPRIGVNVPDSDPDLQAVTSRDLEYAAAMHEAGCDFVAVSFCRDGDDLRRLRTALTTATRTAPHLVAKVERPAAIDHLADIVEASDAILVARGDLGVEMDLASVPVIQKEIVAEAVRGGKPVIVATQMLQSMIDSPSPTRAEATDAANAVIDGADALMLSGETAIGRYPVLAVETLRRIADRTETWLDGQVEGAGIGRVVTFDDEDPWFAGLAEGIGDVVRRLEARAVVGSTTSGRTALLLSRARLPIPIVMLTHNIDAARTMRLLAGVRPVRLDRDPGTGDEFLQTADRIVREQGLAALGEPVVFLQGSGRRGSRPTDMLGVFEAGLGAMPE